MTENSDPPSSKPSVIAYDSISFDWDLNFFYYEGSKLIDMQQKLPSEGFIELSSKIYGGVVLS